MRAVLALFLAMALSLGGGSQPAPAPEAPVMERLEALLDGDCSVRFWIFPGTGPLEEKLPAEYGDALRALFAACDWKEITYEQTQPGEDFAYPPDAYGISLLPSRYSADGPLPMGIRSYEDYVYMETRTRTEEGYYQTRYFRSEGAETLCAAIADLWPGWEAVTGCRTRVPPQEEKEALARTYLEATFDKLREKGHIQDARIDSLEVIPPVYDGESVESNYMSYDGTVALQFKTVFSLKPTRPELTYWQEQGVDKDGWARYALNMVSLSQWGDDGLYELGWFSFDREFFRPGRLPS